MSLPEQKMFDPQNILIGPDITRLGLPIQLGILTGTVRVEPRVETVWQLLVQTGSRISHGQTVDSIKEFPIIADFRELYKRIGKDPSRYRPSSEMLIRRVVRGHGLYNVNSAVDIMNIVSISSHLPLGLYDLDQIQGSVTFRIGRLGESFKGIRKETVNVEELPVLSDQMSPFGNPTSDSERTMIRPETQRIMLVLFSCSGNPGQLLEKTAKQAQDLYEAHSHGQDFSFALVHS